MSSIHAMRCFPRSRTTERVDETTSHWRQTVSSFMNASSMRSIARRCLQKRCSIVSIIIMRLCFHKWWTLCKARQRKQVHLKALHRKILIVRCESLNEGTLGMRKWILSSTDQRNRELFRVLNFTFANSLSGITSRSRWIIGQSGLQDSKRPKPADPTRRKT